MHHAQRIGMILVGLVAVLPLAACGGDSKPSSSGQAPVDKSGNKVAAKPNPGSGPFAAWDLPARTAAWQGAWSGDHSSAGATAAWHVKGDQVTLVDKRGEKTLAFAVTSPCSAKFTETLADGGTSSTHVTFTMQQGAVITGLGSGGNRTGADAVVCAAGKIFTVKAGVCEVWEDFFGDMRSKPGTCGLRGDVFFYDAGGEQTIPVEGDVIWTAQLKATHATKHADFAAAKTAAGL